MILISLITMIMSANFTFVTSGKDGAKYYIDDQSIAQLGEDDVWSFRYATMTSDGQLDGQFCVKPHKSVYAVVSSTFILDSESVDGLEWSNMTPGQIAFSMTKIALEYIDKNRTKYNVDEIRSPEHIERQIDHITKWQHLFGDKFAKTPDKIERNKYQLWVARSPNSGVNSLHEFNDQRVVEVLNRYEISIDLNKIRTCSFISYDANGNVIETDNECADWDPIIPESTGEGYVDFVKANITPSTKPKKKKRE